MCKYINNYEVYGIYVRTLDCFIAIISTLPLLVHIMLHVHHTRLFLSIICRY